MAIRLYALGIAALGCAGLVAQPGARAQEGADRAATFTAAQSLQGKDLYDANCASCHGPSAGGGQFGPSLRGAAFRSRWIGQGPEPLFAYVHDNMPPGAAASLNNTAYSAIVAYLLQANGATPGAAELTLGQAPAAPTGPSASEPPKLAWRGESGAFAIAPPNHDAIYRRATAQRDALLAKLSPVTDAMLRSPPDEDWLMWRRTYAGLGFSPLKAIGAGNVARLGVAWTWALHPSANEITPVVHDGVLFIHSGDAVEAFDAASGDLLWQYVRPLADRFNGGRAARSKGMAIYGHALYLPTIDGHLVALEARTGEVLWDREVLSPADVANGVALNGVPIVAKGKVIMGVAVSLMKKGGCFIFALDAETGEQAWRFNTVAQPGEVGGDSWNGAPADQRFGGGQWTGGSYDPNLNLVYFGVGNTYNIATLFAPQSEPGPENAGLFTGSTVALDPDTGALKWYYQHMARDLWDVDWTFERSLIDLPFRGKTRQLVVTAGKMALFDAVDRATGEYVFSADAGLQNIVVAIDPTTGRKTYNPEVLPVAGEKKLVCPGNQGIRNWQSTTYNPQTHILYVPMLEACSSFTWTPRSAAETAEGGIDQKFQTAPRPQGDGNFGRIQAIDLQSGKTIWTHRQRAPISSSMLATAGGVAFNGSGDRYFRAYDQADGKILWETRLGSAASSSPITYSVNGVQYVAVVAGGGNPQDTQWRTLAPEIINSKVGTTLWVFKLTRD